jgi:hypothetical protein
MTCTAETEGRSAFRPSGLTMSNTCRKSVEMTGRKTKTAELELSERTAFEMHSECKILT